MNAEIFVIIICYVLIGFLLVLFNLRTNFNWLLKASMIAIVTIFYLLTYKSFSNLVGWPSNNPLPDRFRLVAAQIYEPNALINSEGAIFLWVTDMDNLAGLSTPRSYSLPYNKEVHERVSKSLVNLKNGVPQMGESSEEEKTGLISAIIKKEKISSTSTTLNFFDMPNQLLPEK
ncbi:MAG: hypothetical protein CMP32_03245 [Rickettsiales bacterium]|nr:hypothetical protein [Rickettsiales bacterium]|tara:strand:+ start:118 stop:639 length:522 start_codon:yes stop_codon:yes gene_type:complete